MSVAPLRRVLIVSPHFPPVNAPDMQRVRMSLPSYRAYGWEPVVLCVGDEWQDGVREPALAETIPPGLRVVRVPALPRQWTRLIGVGNLGLRCWLHFLFAGARLIRREKIDLVFFSNTQFVTFTLGAFLAAVGGALTAPTVSVVTGMGAEVIVMAFAVVVIGGLGSLPGAALGALIVGLVRAAAVHYQPEVELFSVYFVMAVVLILRPKGLFSGAEVRKI